jgi:hypothetical protein
MSSGLVMSPADKPAVWQESPNLTAGDMFLLQNYLSGFSDVIGPCLPPFKF